MTDNLTHPTPYLPRKASRSWEIEAVLDNFKQENTIEKYGSIVAPGTSTDYDVWTGGITGLIYPFPTVPTQLEAFAGLAGDTNLTGSGAWSIEVFGIEVLPNNDWVFSSETMLMNGTTVTGPTTKEFIRVFRARVRTVGIYNGRNLSQITIQAAGGGDILAIIPLNPKTAKGVGSTEMTHICIPSGFKGALCQVSMNIDTTTKLGDVFLWAREDADKIVAPFSPVVEVETWTGVNNYSPPGVWGPFYGKTDIWFTCRVDANNTRVDISYKLYLIPEHKESATE